MIKLYNRFKKKDFTILAINIKESKSTVKKYGKKAKIPFPILLDNSGEIAQSYGVRGTPAHFLIDKNNNIKAISQGAKNWESKANIKLINVFLEQ